MGRCEELMACVSVSLAFRYQQVGNERGGGMRNGGRENVGLTSVETAQVAGPEAHRRLGKRRTWMT